MIKYLNVLILWYIRCVPLHLRGICIIVNYHVFKCIHVIVRFNVFECVHFVVSMICWMLSHCRTFYEVYCIHTGRTLFNLVLLLISAIA